MRRDLRGRAALVTGATSGIGRAVVDRLDRRGLRVLATGRDVERLADLARATSGRVTVHAADLCDAAERAMLVERCVHELGGVDVLVDNAGAGWVGLVEEMSEEQLRVLVETNVLAALDLARLVLPHMLARGDGDLVLTASSVSWVAAPPLTAYAATKHAVDGFAEGLRREVRRRGVRVHSIHPGPVATEFAARAVGQVPGRASGGARRAPGIDPDRVARTVERVLDRPLGGRSVPVPWFFGLARAAKLAGVREVIDLLTASQAGRLARAGRSIGEQASGGIEPTRPTGPAMTDRPHVDRSSA